MPTRLPEYRRLLTTALDHGYRVISVEEWARLLDQPPGPSIGKLMVMRHDVDTDAALTIKWSEIERDAGVGASYFYRQTTMDGRVIEAVMRAGFHVSYHFEEIAEVAKERRLGSEQAIRQHMPEMQQRFARNLDAMRARFGLDGRIVCSHGDWMNRRLGVRNLELLRDPAFRQQAGVDYETYDEALMTPLNGYYTDSQPPSYWRRSGSPFDAIHAGITPIGVLTHPRQWQPNFASNTAETWRRISEGLAYRGAA
ncbi:MAG: hypothetical protein QM766_05540 [Burkholderiaceae bacterium]